MRFAKSADRHHVSHLDAIWVIENATTVLELQEDPRRRMFIGFDTVGRPREVVVQYRDGYQGEPVCIHADTLTRSYYGFL